MSYPEKKTLVSIGTGLAILAAYGLYAFGRVQSGMVAADDLRFWATTILIFVGVGVLAAIVIQIIFHILLSVSVAVKEQIKHKTCDDKAVEKTIELEMVQDERDKLIELKAMRVGFVVAGIGFLAAMGSLVFNYSPAVMVNILFVSFSVGSMAEGVAQMFYYRHGV